MDDIHKTYRCTDYGADAIAHEDGCYFVVHAGSKFGEVRNANDRMMLHFRRFLEINHAFEEDGLTLRGDERFLYADEAARFVTGCLVNELSWTAIDGSHPTLVSPLDDRKVQGL